MRPQAGRERLVPVAEVHYRNPMAAPVVRRERGLLDHQVVEAPTGQAGAGEEPTWVERPRLRGHKRLSVGDPRSDRGAGPVGAGLEREEPEPAGVLNHCHPDVVTHPTDDSRERP